MELQFEVLEPDQDQRVTGFQIVHEKIFHLLFVHHELEIFRHEHPVLGEDGIFRHKTEFPKAGIYRMLADFYPAGSTPQLIPMTLTTGGFEQSLVAAKPLLLPRTSNSTKRSRRTTTQCRWSGTSGRWRECSLRATESRGMACALRFKLRCEVRRE